jgi:hypothetical protein
MTVKKRLVSGLMAICMLVMLVNGVGAESEDEEIFTFNYGDTDITVCGYDVDGQKAQLVADMIAGETVIMPLGILCIFGHSLARMTVKEITHRYYATAPRCLEKTYDVTYCTRSGCNYTVWTQIGIDRIPCCK